jgi:uncharacterized protein (TIGR02117 family)
MPTTTTRLLRGLVAVLTLLVLLPFFYFALASLGAILPGSHPQIDGGPQTRIALARGPIHYDLLLPMTDALRASFAFAEGQGVPVADPHVRYLMVGWGSRAFYTATGTYADLNLGSIWPALTGDAATLHLDVTGEVEGIPGITWVTLSDTQLTALTQAVTATFTRDAAGNPIPLDALPYGATDAFYAANGRFNILNTCNVWVGSMLRAAGLDFGAWTPTPQSVAFSARWFSPKQS